SCSTSVRPHPMAVLTAGSRPSPAGAGSSTSGSTVRSRRHSTAGGVPAISRRPRTFGSREPASRRLLQNGGMRVALALGSGGARGYAHIGVINELHDRGYEVVG